MPPTYPIHKVFLMQFMNKILGISLLVLSLNVAFPAMSIAADVLSDKQRQEIENIIHQYIMDNPKVILDAVEQMQVRAEAAKQEHVKKQLVRARDLLINDPDSPIGGNPNGDVTVVEFFDYRCGYCKQVYPSVMKSINADKNVRYVFKEFPILGPESVTASKVALAVSRIDATKYKPFHNALMSARGSLTKSMLLKTAKDVGVDPDAVEKEMASPEIEKIIRKNYDLAQSLNISGTPAFVIGEQLVPGAIDYATLEKLIAEARGG